MAMTMMYFVVRTSFVFWLYFHEAFTACTPEEIQSCSGGWSDTNVPKTEAELDSYCHLADKLPSCLENIGCAEDAADTVRAYGLLDGVKYLCTSDYARQVILKNQACISSTLQQAVTSCVDLHSDDPTSHGYVCRVTNKAAKCHYEKMKTQCNEEAAYVYMTIHSKTLTRFLASLDCTLDTSYVVKPKDAPNGVSHMTSSVTSSMMLFILAVVLSYR